MNLFDRLRRKRIYVLPSASASMVSHYANGHRDGRAQGYDAGVQAARDAVAAVGVRKDTSYDMRAQALAAIDALREVSE